MAINNEQDANDILTCLSEKQMTREKLKQELQSKILLLEQEYQSQFLVVDDQIQQYFNDLQNWAENNRPEKCRQIKLENGLLSWRKSNTLQIENEDKIIQKLLNLKLGRYLKQKLSLKKDTLLSEKEGIVQLLDGVTVVENEHFTAKPKTGQAIKSKGVKNASV